MKLSISLPAEEIAFLDGYARSQGIKSRSGVIRAALRQLRMSELVDDYASAWAESDDEDDRLWDRSSSDGLTS
ncbi:MAG: ribbon-helix-helix protein, CopG family [Pseudomonadales bacterium]|nr:ribbon-helix-helix protein, CopG family [Pseudomonadales bacterium]